MMSFPRFGLATKLILCLVFGLILVDGLSGYVRYRVHCRDLEELVIANADQISDIIKRSTRYGMLRNQRDEIYYTINTIAGESGIEKIRIFNEQGHVSFSTDAAEVNTIVDKAAEACFGCHSRAEPLKRLEQSERFRVFRGKDGHRVLGLVNPIENEKDCFSAECHAHPADKQVLGVLDTLLSLAHVDERMAEARAEFYVGLVISLAAASVIAGLFVWFLVHQPVRKLTAATQRVAQGNWESNIEIRSDDEIGILSRSFNQMTVDLRRARDDLIQSEKMASVGKLSAIVAHEINNPLAGIRTYANLLRKKLTRKGELSSADPETEEALEFVENESARCGEIVKHLLQYIKPGQVQHEKQDVNVLIQEAVRLVRHQVEVLNLQLETDLEKEPVNIWCRGAQIKQVLLALLTNACEASAEGGRLCVSCHKADEEVEISVSDNGMGMNEETKRRVFEPFFTTKDSRQAVGLGLSVVHDIVQQHGGRIEVESQPGTGTTFTIRLPENDGESG